MIKVKSTVIFSILLFCMNLALFCFLIIPYYNKYKNEIIFIKEAEVKLQTMKEKERKVEEYQEEIENMDIEIDEINNKVVPSRDIPAVFTELYNTILSNSLETKSITFGRLAEADKYSYFNVTFDIVGHMADIDNFIRYIENNNLIISIDSVNFTAETDGYMKTSLVLKYYLFKDDRSAGDSKNNYSDDSSYYDNNYYYDFMEGKYGTYETWYDMFRSFEK